MASYDLLVIGGGSNVTTAGDTAGLDTALTEPGLLGGPCFDRGCNPSKNTIYAYPTVTTAVEYAFDDAEGDI
jgi:pyruvate/2-oxoglutarate dehydrogenase complex dihydrolipoamide dehydrogenase (E3) component